MSVGKLQVIPLAALVVFASTSTTTGPRCSKRGFIGVRGENAPHFIGTARADTVAAGAGDVSYRVTGGHFGPARDGSIYGQVIAVERYASEATLSADEFPEAIIVPWDYGADCTPTPWSRSARFVKPGVRGFFLLPLRGREMWVDGVPTFDNHLPQFVPFPGDRDLRRRDYDDVLSADELFEVYELLPMRSALRDEDWGAAEGFVSWLRDDPAKLRVYPVEDLAFSLSQQAEDARAKRMTVTASGTYRVIVSLPSAPADTFFLRTAARQSGAWHLAEPPQLEREGDNIWDRRAIGYQLYFWHAATVGELPTDSASATRQTRGEWSLSVSEEMLPGEPLPVWRGHMELRQLTFSLPDNRVLAELVEIWGERFSERWRSGQLKMDEVRFRRLADGQVTFEAEYVVDDQRTIGVYAERISTTTVSGRVR